jgi:hypothetical protein
MPKGERFETPKDVDEENWARKEDLWKGSKKDIELGDKLDACSQRVPCNLCCCSICMRYVRIYRIGEQIRLFSCYDKVLSVTLYFTDNYLPFGCFSKVEWERLRGRLSKQIERTLGKRAVVMGGFEVAADYTKKTWIPHVHLVIANCNRKKVEALRCFYEPDITNQRKMKVLGLKDRYFQMSYAHKYMTLFRPFKQTGSRRPGGVRLRPVQHREHMQFLASKRPLESLFVYNASRNNGMQFKVNPTGDEVMRCQRLTLDLDIGN